MALLEDTFKGPGSSWVPKVLVGLGAALMAPIVLPALTGGMRSLIKTAIKGGILLYDKSQEMIAEAGEQISDLVAEARAELAETARTATARAASTHNDATRSEG